MSRPATALVVTLLSGIAGLYIGASLGMQGYLGIVVAIAVMGAYIVGSLDHKR